MAESLEALARDVVEDRARREPAWATQEGIQGHDHEVADVSRDAYADRIRAIDGFLARLADVRDGSDVDRDTLSFVLGLERFRLARLRGWEKNPDLATEFMDHLFPLLIRTERPLDERVDAMTARLDKAADFLGAGRTRLAPADVPPLWVDVAVESVEQAPAFLEAVVLAASAADATRRARLDAAVQRARDAMDGFRAFLLNDLAKDAKGDFAVGARAFEDLLSARMLPYSADDLWTLGHSLVESHRRELEEHAVTVLAEAGHEPVGDSVRLAWDVVKRDHPATFEGVLAEYRKAIADARAFVASARVASVPEDAEAPLDVIETPSYLRHLMPFAAYVQPARYSPAPRGTYLVTPKADLSAFPLADVRNTTVHEAYPGHHLQLVRARENPSLARFLADAPETIEGWALYCEAVMGRHGFTASPAERFVRAKDALWRALRIVLDVGLHTGRVSYEEALAELERGTGMTREEAEAEVKRYTQSPAYNLSYLIGRLGFERMREARERLPGFREDAFHDALLAQGSLPLPLLERAAFGDTGSAG